MPRGKEKLNTMTWIRQQRSTTLDQFENTMPTLSSLHLKRTAYVCRYIMRRGLIAHQGCVSIFRASRRRVEDSKIHAVALLGRSFACDLSEMGGD